MIDKLQAHYGFTRMPFGRDLAPGMLHRHAARNEAAARITWCVAERAIGVITGEVGAGKTVSVRTVLAGLDQPSVAYDITGALMLAASRLPQLITQITGYLDRALAAGRLGHDLGEDPATAVEATAIFLGDARTSAAALASDLDAAQQQLAPVNGTPRTRKEQS